VPQEYQCGPPPQHGCARQGVTGRPVGRRRSGGHRPDATGGAFFGQRQWEPVEAEGEGVVRAACLVVDAGEDEILESLRTLSTARASHQPTSAP